MNKELFGLAGMIFIGIPNAMLTALFFYVGIGKLGYVMDEEHAKWIVLIIAGGIAIGFLLAEILIHSYKRTNILDKIFVYSMLTVLCLINWGAGYYRNQEEIRFSKEQALLNAQNDPRYQAALQDKIDIKRDMLNDKLGDNDAEARIGISEATAAANQVVEEYLNIYEGGRSSLLSKFIISGGFILVTALFGFCCYMWLEGKKENGNSRIYRKRKNVRRKKKNRIGFGRNLNGKPKEDIQHLLSEGYANIEIASMVGCSPSYVSQVKNNKA